MKRIVALVCTILLAAAFCVPASFAAEDDQASSNKSNLKIEQASPEDGAEGVAVDNFSVKIYFNKAVKPKDQKMKKFNAKQFVLKSKEGTRIPIKVYYSDDEEGLLMVAADVVTADKDHQIKGGEKYTLTIKKNFTATDGSKMFEKQEMVYETLNQQRSMMIYMLLMVLMMGGMVFFTVRSTKKAAEKEKEEKKQSHVNPYKEAKKTGKSVEEIVAKDSKKKRKKEEAEAKQKELEAAIEAEIMEKIRKESNKRVSAPKPISAVGSTYKVKVVKDSGKKVEEPKESKAKSSKGTTNPKNQSGKKKNSKKNKKGKK